MITPQSRNTQKSNNRKRRQKQQWSLLVIPKQGGSAIIHEPSSKILSQSKESIYIFSSPHKDSFSGRCLLLISPCQTEPKKQDLKFQPPLSLRPVCLPSLVRFLASSTQKAPTFHPVCCCERSGCLDDVCKWGWARGVSKAHSHFIAFCCHCYVSLYLFCLIHIYLPFCALSSLFSLSFYLSILFFYLSPSLSISLFSSVSFRIALFRSFSPSILTVVSRLFAGLFSDSCSPLALIPLVCAASASYLASCHPVQPPERPKCPSSATVNKMWTIQNS